MLLLLMRHAERVRTPHGSDQDRQAPLTAQGVLDVEDIAWQVSEKLAGRCITHALSSPHCAAVETATRLLVALHIDLRASPDPSLDPDPGIKRDPRPLASAVDALRVHDDGVVLIVGHQPMLVEAGRYWTGGYVSPDYGEVAFIRMDGANAEFLCMLKPRRGIATS